MRGALTGLVAVAVLVPLGCGSGPEAGPEEASEPTDAAADSEADGSDAATVTGTLAGDAQLEGGCAWLDTEEGSVEVRWPEGYEVSLEPLRLRGPGDDVVAEGGDEVTVRGEFADDLVSACQVGRIFRAETVVE